MQLDDILAKLESLGSESVRALDIRKGANGAQFGVKLGDLRTLAKSLGANHALALELWETANLDARLLAVLLIKPKALTAAELDRLVRSNAVPQLSDWLNAYVVKAHPDKEALRRQWLAAGDPMAARAGWSLTAERIAKTPGDLDLPALLDRIEAELATAPPLPQWTMNAALAAIGIHHPEHRPRALAIGAALGVYRDYPTSPGCTSPFAPDWIGEMVRRQAAG
ncbi:MAG: DNA alkylation repair protein [Pseudomonadota bacterium]